MTANAAAAAITQGALRAVFEQGPEAVGNPVLQCLSIKRVDKNGVERYRVILSDTQNFIQTMLAMQANHVITSGKLKRGSIIRLNTFNPNEIKGTKIFIILSLDVLEEYGEHEKIGEPKSLDPKVELEDYKPQPETISGTHFYGNQPQQHENPQQTRTVKSNATTANPSHANLYPIEAITEYNRTWSIKARCTHKTEIKYWHKGNSEGKLFSVTLLDESGEIRATAFKEQCDQFYDLFQEGGVYYISTPCTVKPANKRFTNVKHDYELTFQSGTVIEKAENQDDVPQNRFNFISIGKLDTIEPNTTIDAIGILTNIEDAQEITSKDRPFTKRELTIADNTGTSVRLTIWGKTAMEFDAPLDTVIAFKGVKVSDFGGRSLSLLSSGTMILDPDIDDAHRLKGWYDAEGRNTNFTTHASMGSTMGGKPTVEKTIRDILGDDFMAITNDAPQYFSLKGTVKSIKKDPVSYPACRNEKCNKKVVQYDENWHCENCSQSFESPQYRYVLLINVSDHTGNTLLSCFDDAGRIILGMSADELHELQSQQGSLDESGPFTNALDTAQFKQYNFRVRAKMDNYENMPRIRYQVMNVYPLDYSKECAKLASILKSYHVDSDSLFVQ